MTPLLLLLLLRSELEDAMFAQHADDGSEWVGYPPGCSDDVLLAAPGRP